MDIKEAAIFLMGSSNPRLVFLEAFLSLWRMTAETSSTLQYYKCRKGHELLVLLKQITLKTFKMFMSNLCMESNSALKLDKTSRKSTKNESARKVSKLQSDL